MELLLSRSQSKGLTGGPVFVLNVRAALTSQEEEHVRKYRLGQTVVYEKKALTEHIPDPGLVKQLAKTAAGRIIGRVFVVDDLVKGRKVKCKDIVEMLEAEEQIKEAAEVFYTILMTCQHFGGEEVIKYPRED